MAKVIVFSGIDGSGKSEHARKLVYELISCSKSAKYLWMRGKGKTFFSFPLLVLCRLLKITKVHKLENETKVSEYPFHIYKPLRLLWPWLQLIDSIIYATVLIRLPLVHSHDILIIDRSVIDTLVDAISDVHSPYGIRILQRLFLSLLPNNSLLIVLDVDEEIAMRRKKDILSKRYLSTRRKIYESLAKIYNWPIVLTSENFIDTHGTLLRMVEEWLSQ